VAASPNSAWKKWYKQNKEAYNARRKAQRDEDPELRERIAAAQRERRANAPRPEKDGPRYKVVNKKKVEVFRIGQVAKACNRTEQVIRMWEREGKIPKPIIPGGHRYYTQNQLNMLVEFAELMDEVRYDPSVRSVAVDKKSAELAANWKTLT
jgi:hypothetical protein